MKTAPSLRRKTSDGMFVCVVLVMIVYVVAFVSWRNESVVEEEERAIFDPLLRTESLETSSSNAEYVEKREPPVLLISTSRSGSTSIGNVFNYHSDVFYVFEPFKLQNMNDPKLLRDIFDCTVWKDPAAAKRMLWARRHRPMWYETTLGSDPSFRTQRLKLKRTEHAREIALELCKRRPVQVYKTIRFNEANHTRANAVADLLMSHPSGMRLISVLRHPGAIWASQIRIGWRFKRDDRTWIRDICEQTLLANRALRKRSENERERVLFVYFEDFLRATEETIEKLLRFAGLSVRQTEVADIYRLIREINGHPNKGRTAPKKTSALLSAWKKELTAEQHALMEAECEEACAFLGYTCGAGRRVDGS
eukprot:g3581.t1